MPRTRSVNDVVRLLSADEESRRLMSTIYRARSGKTLDEALQPSAMAHALTMVEDHLEMRGAKTAPLRARVRTVRRELEALIG